MRNCWADATAQGLSLNAAALRFFWRLARAALHNYTSANQRRTYGAKHKPGHKPTLSYCKADGTHKAWNTKCSALWQMPFINVACALRGTEWAASRTRECWGITIGEITCERLVAFLKKVIFRCGISLFIPSTLSNPSTIFSNDEARRKQESSKTESQTKYIQKEIGRADCWKSEKAKKAAEKREKGS